MKPTNDSAQNLRELRTVARRLAQEMQAPEDLVLEVYEAEVARLSASATVWQFLGVLAAKHVKAALRGSR
jgi:hypothetical protein